MTAVHSIDSGDPGGNESPFSGRGLLALGGAAVVATGLLGFALAKCGGGSESVENEIPTEQEATTTSSTLGRTATPAAEADPEANETETDDKKTFTDATFQFLELGNTEFFIDENGALDMRAVDLDEAAGDEGLLAALHTDINLGNVNGAKFADSSLGNAMRAAIEEFNSDETEDGVTLRRSWIAALVLGANNGTGIDSIDELDKSEDKLDKIDTILNGVNHTDQDDLREWVDAQLNPDKIEFMMSSPLGDGTWDDFMATSGVDDDSDKDPASELIGIDQEIEVEGQETSLEDLDEEMLVVELATVDSKIALLVTSNDDLGFTFTPVLADRLSTGIVDEKVEDLPEEEEVEDDEDQEDTTTTTEEVTTTTEESTTTTEEETTSTKKPTTTKPTTTTTTTIPTTTVTTAAPTTPPTTAVPTTAAVPTTQTPETTATSPTTPPEEECDEDEIPDPQNPDECKDKPDPDHTAPDGDPFATTTSTEPQEP